MSKGKIAHKLVILKAGKSRGKGRVEKMSCNDGDNKILRSVLRPIMTKRDALAGIKGHQ